MKRIQNSLIVSCQALEAFIIDHVKNGTCCKDGGEQKE